MYYNRAAMFTPTRLLYIIGAAVGGGAAGGYVAWAIAARFAHIAALNDRAIVEPHILVVLCAAGGLLAFPLGAAAGLVVVTILSRVTHYLRRSRPAAGGGEARSWVTRRARDDRAGE